MNEDNPPIMLPSGDVYSEKGIQQNSYQNFFMDPWTSKSSTLSLYHPPCLTVVEIARLRCLLNSLALSEPQVCMKAGDNLAQETPDAFMLMNPVVRSRLIC